jgi:Raf kinase inhibitor-like YbhB/YbcL family protein
MRITSESFAHKGRIPVQYAFGRIPDDPSERFTLGGNTSPHLTWKDAPAGTKSFVVLCIDDDVPSVPDDVNKEGRVVQRGLPRVSFVHWIMVDVPASVHTLPEGSCGRGVVARGKVAPPGPAGARQGVNDYTGWFQGDKDMGGTYLGYDGPCPPWNDELVHRYHFRVFALDVARLPVKDGFKWADVQRAMADHVLGEATHSGKYTMNRGVHV